MSFYCAQQECWGLHPEQFRFEDGDTGCYRDEEFRDNGDVSSDDGWGTLSESDASQLRALAECRAKEHMDPWDTQTPDWKYILDSTQTDLAARLRKFLLMDNIDLSIHQMYDESRRPNEFCGYTSIQIAIRLGNLKAVQLLADSGAKVDEVDRASNTHCRFYNYRKGGDSALHMAVKTNNTVAAEILINSGANIEVRNGAHHTALHTSIIHLKPELTRYLLSKGADSSAIAKNDGTVLHMAVSTGRSHMVDLFVELGQAEMLSKVVHGWPVHGTPFDLACKSRLIAPFWTLILHGMNYSRVKGQGGTELSADAKILKPYAKSSLGLKLESHAIVQFLETLLLSQTFAATIEATPLSDYCHSCSRLRDHHPEEFRTRVHGIMQWKRLNLTFSFGYIKRCELCRIPLFDLAARLPNLLIAPAERATEIGRSFDAEDDYRYLMHANRSRDRSSSGPQAMMNVAAYWIIRCLKSHPECGGGRQAVQLPRLLIDVRLGGPDCNPFLKESASKETGFYFALSYLWGPEPLTTEMHNLEQHKESLPKASMPSVIKDAISLTRQLGCQYLWVDALCIVQDDIERKEMDINAMDLIYRNATVTIAAAIDTSNSQSTGLFQPQVKKGPGPFQSTAELRKSAGHALDTRGWVLQEQILSARLLSYSPEDIFWTCNGVQVSGSCPSPGEFEAWTSKDMRRETTKLLQAEDSTASSAFIGHRLWPQLVEDFTSRELSVENDRVAAMAGITSSLQTVLNDKLIAGHWRCQLANSLPWYVESDYARRWRFFAYSLDGPELSRSRPTTYESPSWSWTSILGPVKYYEVFRRDIRPSEGAKLLDRTGSNQNVSILSVSVKRDPLTRSTSAALTLCGSLMKARARSCDISMVSFCGGECGAHEIPTSHGEVTREWLPDITSDNISELYCFHVLGMVTLCLVPTGNADNEFRRVGYCDWETPDMSRLVADGKRMPQFNNMGYVDPSLEYKFWPKFTELECPEISSRVVRDGSHIRFAYGKEYKEIRRVPRSELATIVIV